MGSGFAAKIASDNKPRYLILDAPYYNFRKVVERFIPVLPVRWVLKYHLRTDKWIRHVNCHTYILHGTKDWLIPIRHSVKLQSLNPTRSPSSVSKAADTITFLPFPSIIISSGIFCSIEKKTTVACAPYNFFNNGCKEKTHLVLGKDRPHHLCSSGHCIVLPAG